MDGCPWYQFQILVWKRPLLGLLKQNSVFELNIQCKEVKQECIPCIIWKGQHIIISSIWYQVFEELHGLCGISSLLEVFSIQKMEMNF